MKNNFLENDVLYGKLRPYLNKVVVADSEGYSTSEIVSLRGYLGINSHFLKYFLRSESFITYIKIKAYGTKMPRLGTNDAKSAVFPLPPYEEQQRIVSRVDELMALCDQLEAMEADKRAARAEALRVSLARLLDAPDAAAVSARWSSLSAHWSQLLDAPESVAPLRQTILGLAVRGQLVPQDAFDEPASQLLKQIAGEKERKVKAGELRQSAPLAPISADEMPFELPGNWAWVRLEEVFHIVSIGSRKIKTSEISESGQYPVVDQGQKFVAGYTDAADCLIKIPGPVIIFGDHTRALKYVNFDFVAGADGVKILRPIEISEWFFFRVLETFQFEKAGYSRHFKFLTSNLFPLPPLAEQQRIVARVDELMALCDQLEAGLVAAQSASEALGQAAVRRLSAAA